jgi:ABC-type multidrug transport system ATPase subunit
MQPAVSETTVVPDQVWKGPVTIAPGQAFSAHYPVDKSPVSLVWKHLAVKAADGKALLHICSGVAHGGGITAIIGPTGSGKTTLLNALVGATRNATASGDVRLNGAVVTGKTCKTLVGYVAQEDVLDGHMTVLECLTFAAQMQLGHLPEAERGAVVDHLLEELGIAHVKDTIIGTATRRGVSGGQRRRVSICLGLLRRPRILVLDEPTCGLDSTTALQLVQTLHRIATISNVAVVMAIHQPQQAIFELFDQLLCLRGGRVIYHGGASACVSFLEELGYPHDGVTGYADHIVEVISPAVGQTNAEKEKDCPLLLSYLEPDVDLSENSTVKIDSTVTTQSWGSQAMHCFRRLGTSEVRKYGAHAMNLFATLGCALLIGGAYFHIPETQDGSKLRLAILFFLCINQSLFGAMKVILAFPDLRLLALAERRAGLYSLSPFFIAYTLVDLLYTIIWPFLFALPVVYMAGLQTGGRFFGLVLMLYLDKVCATSLAMMITSLTRVTSAALVVLPMAIEMSRLFSGFYLAPNAVPGYFVWLDPLSYVKYAFIGAALNELPPVTYACTSKAFNATTNMTTYGVCNPTLPTTGEAQIHANGYDFISYGGCVGALLAYLVFTRTIAYVAMLKLKN